MLDSVKLSLRLSHSALDLEIQDLIGAARLDLIQSGISQNKANDDADLLIKRAIILYVKANFEADDRKAERFKKSYDSLKLHLSLAGDYSA